jgi:hypothetical protein
LADLTIEGSYWKKISQELQKHLGPMDTKFWHKGFDILQNMNDRMTLEKELNWAKDQFFLSTKSKKA